MDNRNFRHDGKDPKGFGRSAIADFLDKQGIYVVMLGCLALIGITAYFALGQHNKGDTAKSTPASELQQAANQPVPNLAEEIQQLEQAAATAAPIVLPETMPKIEVQHTSKPKATSKPETSENNTPVEAHAPPVKVKMIQPVHGDVLRPYSPTEPVYFATLNEWAVHLGIDIRSEEGTNILAALDGTIIALGNRSGTGYTVEIDHGDNKKTVYGNLASLEGLQTNQTVKRGDIIGMVGHSANSTLADPPHLHFEYWIGDQSQNPADSWQPQE